MEDCKGEPPASHGPLGGCLLALSLWPTGRLLSFRGKPGLGESGELGIGWGRGRGRRKGLDDRDMEDLKLTVARCSASWPLLYCVSDLEYWAGPQSIILLKDWEYL